MTDKNLLELLKRDPGEGINRLLSQFSGFVFSVVRCRLEDVCDSSEIEDCVTEVFIKFSSNLDGFRAESSLKTYLGVIARNAALDRLRKRVPSISMDERDFLIDVPDPYSVEDGVADRILLETVFSEIKAMGKPDSEILFRKYYLGQSSASVAKALRLSVSNVDTRAHRALKKLRAKFGGEEK
ncbi:MAG: sigma-70 family RNA polymerase sigma factor [Clostridia bacterium]|nr:sigma-70 family RNA polymerase sigma factor [Clostridia bacterium]